MDSYFGHVYMDSNKISFQPQLIDLCCTSLGGKSFMLHLVIQSFIYAATNKVKIGDQSNYHWFYLKVKSRKIWMFLLSRKTRWHWIMCWGSTCCWINHGDVDPMFIQSIMPTSSHWILLHFDMGYRCLHMYNSANYIAICHHNPPTLVHARVRKPIQAKGKVAVSHLEVKLQRKIPQ